MQLASAYGDSLSCVKPGLKGSVSPGEIISAINDKTILITLIYAQNETGSLNPLSKLRSLLPENSEIKIHVDASQAVSKVSCGIQEGGGLEGCDLITVTGHKFGAPKGISALWIREGFEVRKVEGGGIIFKGGGQMSGLRR
ncbi:hypothetical protein TL16_g12753 [Triparma laevis f. inornata]|uniref:Aminotransferase class V domain-containing protein n=1 Tax=Triparma laevis f. inornata TaxID=1714386 RepID=A0A9W7BT01_9STRA|nr:hypothetical protein TL16_g12753 [Triparma laevis f. inornata]